MGVKFLVLIFVGCFLVQSQSYEFKDILTNITDIEQLRFIQFHVTRGFFKAMNISTSKYENGYSEDYSKQLFEALVSLSKSEKHNPLESNLKHDNFTIQITICTPEGICFDPDDSGIHP